MSLKPEQVKAAIASGETRKIADGRSLYLYTKNRCGFWVYQWQQDGKARSKSLGPAWELSPAQARKARDAFVVTGRAAVGAATRKGKGELFSTAAASYLDNHSDEWTTRTRADNRSLVERYATKLAPMPVTAITCEDIAETLRPVWDGPGNNRGSRLRRLVFGILAAKGVHPNPALWEGGQLRELLSRKTADVKHREAMDWRDVPTFAAKLTDSVEDRAGRFVILTAVRRKEGLGALWGEFDFANRVWTVPAERTKKRRVHKVPLTDQMLACLGEPGAADAFVFPSGRTGRMLGNKACDKEWHGLEPFTLHGFRTSLSTWAQEQDDGKAFAPAVILAALAHNTQENESDASYLRSDLFEARRKLMQGWSDHVNGSSSDGA